MNQIQKSFQSNSLSSGNNNYTEQDEFEIPFYNNNMNNNNNNNIRNNKNNNNNADNNEIGLQQSSDG